MSQSTRKRSFKRAIRRAMRMGQCRYKGQVYTRAKLVQMGYSLPNQAEEAQPSSSSNDFRGKRTSRPGQQSRARRLKVFSWNAGGLAGDVFDMLLVYLDDMKIDVAFVQETRWGFTGNWEAHGFFCFHGGISNNSTVKSGEAGGVMTLVRKDLASASSLRWCVQVPGRLLQVRFPHGNQFVELSNVYQHYCARFTMNNDKTEQYHSFWFSLDNVLSSLAKRNIVVLGGDFNAQISPMSPYVGMCTGSSMTKDVDHELMAILAKHHLCALNTWTATSHYTCSGPRGGGSVIDIVSIRLPQADPCKKSSASV